MNTSTLTVEHRWPIGTVIRSTTMGWQLPIVGVVMREVSGPSYLFEGGKAISINTIDNTHQHIYLAVTPETKLPDRWMNYYPWTSTTHTSRGRAEGSREATCLGTLHIFGTVENPQIETVWNASDI